MPGLFGVFGIPEKELSNDELAETIDPLHSDESFVSDLPGGRAGVGWLRDNPLGDSVLSRDGEMPGFFCGDLVDYRDVPWAWIRKSVSGGDAGWLKNLRGTFVIFLHDKNSGILYLVSDRLSQHPAYYALSRGSFAFSTAIATLCRLCRSPKLSREWLYEFLYFNTPVGDTAQLAGVKRLPPASVLSVPLDTLEPSLSSYAAPFSRPENLLEGRRGIARALDVFTERLPRYYPDRGNVAVSLTAGFDSRTVLTFAPEESRDRVTVYTYGVPGTYDLVDATRTARALGFRHLQIHFDEEFRRRLEGLIRETVFLSGGLEKAHRATLSYVYGILAGNGERYPVVLTGLSGDHLFRDHVNGRGNVPSIISADMMDTIQSGEVRIDSDLYSRIFAGRYDDFRDHVHGAIEGLTARHGELRDPAAYLRYLVYESAPKYFGGEYALARNFTAVRSPFWDPDIISLAFGIEYGTLGFSETLPRKDPYRETVLQGHIIHTVSGIGGSRIRGIPISAFSSNNKARYGIMKAIWKLPGKVRRCAGHGGFSPLEDWKGWLLPARFGGAQSLLPAEPRLAEYISADFIHSVRGGDDIILLGKLITAETILDLIANGWALPGPGR